MLDQLSAPRALAFVTVLQRWEMATSRSVASAHKPSILYLFPGQEMQRLHTENDSGF